MNAPTLSDRLDAYTLFLVDMDDTLFEERDYARSGFHAVAEHIGRRGLDADAADRFLHNHFRLHGRVQIFDHLLLHLTGAISPDHVKELVAVYREHEPRIAFYPGAHQALSDLRRRGKVILVTDGLATMQQRKFAALGLDRLVDRAVFCEAAGHPKPDPAALAGLVEPGDPHAVLIGDRPDHDLALAAALRIDSIRVRTGRFRDRPNDPWHPIADLPAFADLLDLKSNGK